MTKSKKARQPSATNPITTIAEKGESETNLMARAMIAPYLRHGAVTNGIAEKMFGTLPGKPGLDGFGRAIKSRAEASLKGDMTLASELLTAQVLSLDAMFTELTRRATMNLGDYPMAAERYARLAFKAQANCRSSLEALARLHQPREQTVRHVHVNEGGQAVVADHFHNHAGGGENAKSSEQPHATGAAGAGPALPCPDPFGNGVPIASSKRAEALPNARGEKSRRAEGKPEC